MRKWIAVCMALSMLLFAGCSVVHYTQRDEISTAAMMPTQETTEPSKTEIEPEATAEPESPILRVLVTDYHLNEYDPDSEYVCFAQVSYSKLELDDVGKEKHRELQTELDALYVRKMNAAAASLKDLAQRRKEDRDMWESYEDPVVYNDDFRMVVQRADENVLSVLEFNEFYGGGVHGSNDKYGINFDPVSGKQLTIADILNVDQKTFQAALKEEVLKVFREEDLFAPETVFDGSDKDWNFTVGYEGVTIHFNAYDLGSYAMGGLDVCLCFRDYPDFFRSQYLQVPEKYVIAFEDNKQVKFDVDMDGKTDTVGISGRFDYSTYEGKWQIEMNGSTFDPDIGAAFSVKPFLIHTPEANFLCLVCAEENDYHEAYVFDITNGQPVLTDRGNYDQGLVMMIWDDETRSFIDKHEELLNPDRMYLSSRVDAVGTYTGSRYYHLTETGKVVPDEDSFTVIGGQELTFEQEITGKTADGSGNYTFRIGEKANVCKVSEDRSLVTLRSETGAQVVFDYTQTADYEYALNGVKENALFTIVPYAG